MEIFYFISATTTECYDCTTTSKYIIYRTNKFSAEITRLLKVETFYKLLREINCLNLLRICNGQTYTLWIVKSVLPESEFNTFL